MATRRRFQFIYGLALWLSVALFVLALLESVTLELIFVISLIGFLIITELTAPFTVTPQWRDRLKWIIALGVLIFGAIVVRRILVILPPGVF